MAMASHPPADMIQGGAAMTSGSIQASPAATEQQSAPEDTGKDTEDTKDTQNTQKSAKKGTKRRHMHRTPMGSHQKAETRALSGDSPCGCCVG